MKTYAELQKDVQDAIKWELLLHSAEIGVILKGGIVTLTGTVDSYVKKLQAEHATKNVSGVKILVEDIEVKLPDPQSKTDVEIAGEIIAAFNANSIIPQEKITVKVENGWVDLDGEVSWEYIRDITENAVRYLPGVKGIYNNITINPEIRDTVEKSDIERAVASITSDGLMGDKILIISPGTTSTTIVKDNDIIASYKTIEIDDLFSSVKQSADNAKAITDELVESSAKMNNKSSLLTKIMTNKDFASRVDRTIENLQLSSLELAKFTSILNNKNGTASKIFTDKKWSDNIENSISNLQNSSHEISMFTKKLNDKNNVFSQLSSNDSLALSIEKTLRNLEKSSDDLIQFTSKINNDENVLSKLTNDPKLGKSVDSTIVNIEKGVGELREIEAAAKNNFLLRDYFNKKKKETEKQKR